LRAASSTSADQNDPEAFLDGPLQDVTKFPNQPGPYAQRDFRGAVRTTGEFDINRNWSFGWAGLLQTDRGELVYIRNAGIRHAAPDVIASMTPASTQLIFVASQIGSGREPAFTVEVECHEVHRFLPAAFLRT
jgi:hypothetical protein